MIIDTETHLNLSVLPQRVDLLMVPAELRLQILSFALSIDCGDERIASLDIARKARKAVSHGTTSLGLLLVCRQIYHEARLLPFQNSEFAFQRWYGSSTAECLRFFQKLQPWQISVLRSLKLDITEADLGGLSRVDEVCSCLFPKSVDGVGVPGGPGLQHLSIHISRAGLWPDPADFEALFDLARKWSVQGILRLTSLRTLNITVASSVKIPAQTAKALEEQLRDRMPWCSKVSVLVKQEKSPRQKFEEFSRAMGWGVDGPGTL
jgi:hypothetical protein